MHMHMHMHTWYVSTQPNVPTHAFCFRSAPVQNTTNAAVEQFGDGQLDCDDPDCARSMRCNIQGGRGGRPSCDTTALYGTLMECTQWSATAMADGVLDESDGFCTSTCYTQLAPEIAVG